MKCCRVETWSSRHSDSIDRLRLRCAGRTSLAFLMIALGLCGTAYGEGASQQITQDNRVIRIEGNGRSILEYRYGEVPFKPYVSQFCTPAGIQILRDAPADHLHHHGLMYALAIDDVDFWAESPECGKQVAEKMTPVQASTTNARSRATFTQSLNWVGKEGAKLAREERFMRLDGNPAWKATLLTWRSRLEPATGRDTIRLSGSHYFGLGMRFVEPMDKAGRFFNSEGTEGPIVRGSERVTPAKWCAYASSVDGKPVTVAMFADPKNVRPAHFFTMRPFAYLAATANLWKEPMELKAGTALDLRYGIAAFDGESAPSQVAEIYRQWVAMLD